MTSKKFVSDVIKQIPEFSSIDGYFYVRPVDVVLTGIVANQKPSDLEINFFYFPLYNSDTEISMLHSERLSLPEGDIDIDKVGRKNLSLEFVARVKPLLATCFKRNSLSGLLDTLDNIDPWILNAPKIRSSYAATLIMANRFNEAMVHLIVLIEEPQACGEDFDLYNKYLLDTLKKDPPSAKDFLVKRAEKTKEDLGIV